MIRKRFTKDTGNTLPNGLVDYYKFQGNGRGSFAENDMRKIGDVNYTPGKIGLGGFFPEYPIIGGGQNNYLQIDSVLTTSQTITVDAWVYLVSAAVRCNIMVVGNGDTDGWGFAIGNTTGLEVGNHIIGVQAGIAWKNFNQNIGTGWHYLRMSKEYNGLWKAYIDNVQCPTTFTGNFLTPHDRSMIGVNPYDYSKPDIYIDELALWNRILTTTEHNDRWNNGAGNTLELVTEPFFVGIDLSTPAFTWSAGENTAKPLANLKTFYPDKVSGSNGTADSQTLLIDQGSAVPCNTIIIHNHNFDLLNLPSVKVTLQTNTNDDTNFADAINVAAVPISEDPLVYTFTETTKRYWRILFTKGSALSAAPETGNIYLGKSLDFEFTQQWGYFLDMPESVNNVGRTQEGRIHSAEHYTIARHELEFKLHSDAFVTAWRSFLRTVKENGRPFYFIDNKMNIWFVNFEKSFIPAKNMNCNLNDIVRFGLVSTMGE